MGIDVRFTGRRRSMWRHIRNPVFFFAPENGWEPMGANITPIGDAVFIMNWYVKGSMSAWYLHIKEHF